jgi:hypothetical protein
LSFSASVFVGYAVTVVFWELWTPWWAGDHIGFSFGAIFFYAIGGLLWVGTANAVYSLGRFGERFVNSENLGTYRKYAHGVLLTLGAMSSVLWFAEWMLEAWLRRR